MKKEELKEILRPVVKEICSQMHDELPNEIERQMLALEFSTAIIASTINFNQDFDSFSKELSMLMTNLIVQGGEQIVRHKSDFDKGKSKGEIL